MNRKFAEPIWLCGEQAEMQNDMDIDKWFKDGGGFANMKNYTKIDERHTEYGLFELLEHNVKGDTVPCIVTLNDYILCGTYDTLDTVIESYRDGDDFI